MGGNPSYPKPIDSKVYLYRDKIELHFWNGDTYNKESNLTVPFGSMNSIENMDEKKISALRVIGLGLVFVPLAIVGAMWKKNHIYTVIKYKDDEPGEKAIIIDFGDVVDTVQGWIFRRMLNSTQYSTITLAGDFVNYENSQYGFSLRYPRTWVDDELYQMKDSYTEVVKIRKFIENKSPYVTVYCTEVPSTDLKPEEIVNSEIQAIRNDINMTVSESSSLVIDNKPAANLVFVDYNGYKHKVIWITSNDAVFKISYYAEKGQYLEDLPSVMEVIDSFKMGERSMRPSPKKLEDQKSVDADNPLTILKIRFAKGEITEEQYERMRKILADT